MNFLIEPQQTQQQPIPVDIQQEFYKLELEAKRAAIDAQEVANLKAQAHTYLDLMIELRNAMWASTTDDKANTLGENQKFKPIFSEEEESQRIKSRYLLLADLVLKVLEPGYTTKALDLVFAEKK